MNFNATIIHTTYYMSRSSLHRESTDSLIPILPRTIPFKFEPYTGRNCTNNSTNDQNAAHSTQHSYHKSPQHHTMTRSCSTVTNVFLCKKGLCQDGTHDASRGLARLYGSGPGLARLYGSSPTGLARLYGSSPTGLARLYGSGPGLARLYGSSRTRLYLASTCF